ncbi:hypothetical protein VPH35_024214 [Triticum aestivum]
MEGGSLWHEFETDLPAADVWEVYGGLAVGRLIPQLLPHVLSKVASAQSCSSPSLLKVRISRDSEPRSYKEKFNVIDNEKYIKEAETIEGGFLDLGFRKHLMRIEIVGKEDGKSVIRSTVEYEVDAEHAKNVSLVSTQALASVAEAITKHIKEQKKSPEQATE